MWVVSDFIFSGMDLVVASRETRQHAVACDKDCLPGEKSSLFETDADWYAVHTRSRHEYLVRDHLFSKSWRVFLPERTVWSRRRDRRKQIRVPLFPGYLFVSSGNGAEYLREVRCTRGVVRLLGVDGCPLPVPRCEMESLQVLVASGEQLQLAAYLVPGARVRVVEGPLAGAEGTVVRFGRKRHLVVSVELMQRSVAVELAEWQLERTRGR